ncbi:MAG: ATP phosphoribosyltransferase regulatory subunit [Alphaproteobacteria bacterium]|nr:ATP phosphoribosyltransferase regulatory subunit [Alphaproteobacteria bacterium]
MTQRFLSFVGGAAAHAQALTRIFTTQGFERIDPPVLLPVDIFVELSGEDIRRRLFLVSGPFGERLCLRPDFTLPVARHYVNETDRAVRRYVYGGPTFRCSREDSDCSTPWEFQQVGIEILGPEDGTASEIEVVRTIIHTLRDRGVGPLKLRFGDTGLFNALLDFLKLPHGMRRRLRRHFLCYETAFISPEAISSGQVLTTQQALTSTLSSLDRKAGTQLIQEVIALARLAPVGGRSVEEIVERFMERADSSFYNFSADIGDLICSFLKIRGSPSTAHAQFIALTRNMAPDLASHIDEVYERLCTLQEHISDSEGIDIVFDAGFGHRLEYYDGLVFEISAPLSPGLGTLASGGRYDSLLGKLGASGGVSAFGAALYVDRLIRATGFVGL